MGVVDPHSSLSDFSDTRWATGTGLEIEWLRVEVEGQDVIGPVSEMKMKPVRYTFGGHESTDYAFISAKQANVGPRYTCPPTSAGGHVVTMPVSSLIPPNMTMVRWSGLGVSRDSNGLNSVLRAVGISKNGTHVGIIDFGSSISLSAVFTNSVLYKTNASIAAQAISITCTETDTIEIDYYVHVLPRSTHPFTAYINLSSGTGSPALALQGSVASGFLSPSAVTAGPLTLNSVESIVDDATGHKVIFSDNGPAGLSELSFASAPSGWTLSAFAGGVRLNKSDGTYIVTFGWMQEIPYLEIFNASKAGTYARVRYRPIASNDYDAISTKATAGSATQEYGVWKYQEFNPYTNRVVRATFTDFGPWFEESEIGSAAFNDYPAFVVIAPVTATSDLYTSGSGTWSCPVNGYVLAEYRGPGGGGGAGEDGSNAGGSGGGGGGYGAKLLLLTNTDTIAYSVGSVGTKGTYPNDDATAGGNTTVAGGTYTAVGGGRGRGQGNGSIVGAGGTASGGDVSETGTSGSANSGNNGGAGGQGANSGGTGGTAGVSTTTDGGTGSNYGGGGGGGGKEKDGGNGGSGFVRFTYFI